MSIRIKVIVFLQAMDGSKTGQSAVSGIIEEDSPEVMSESFSVYAGASFASAYKSLNSVAFVETEPGLYQTRHLAKGPGGEQ